MFHIKILIKLRKLDTNEQLTSSKMYVLSKTYVLRLQRDYWNEAQFLPIHFESCLVSGT